MNIEKFNDEEMIFKTSIKFKNGDTETIYLGEKEITKFMSRKWTNPFFAYTDHIDTYVRRLDDIQMIYIESSKTLTETNKRVRQVQCSYSRQRALSVRMVLQENAEK